MPTRPATIVRIIPPNIKPTIPKPITEIHFESFSFCRSTMKPYAIAATIAAPKSMPIRPEPLPVPSNNPRNAPIPPAVGRTKESGLREIGVDAAIVFILISRCRCPRSDHRPNIRLERLSAEWCQVQQPVPS